MSIIALLLELPENLEKQLETEAQNYGFSPSDYIAYLMKGVVPPRIGNGTYEDIKTLVETFMESDDADGLIAAIEENRTMRRQLAQERDE